LRLLEWNGKIINLVPVSSKYGIENLTHIYAYEHYDSFHFTHSDLQLLKVQISSGGKLNVYQRANRNKLCFLLNIGLGHTVIGLGEELEIPVRQYLQTKKERKKEKRKKERKKERK
jgi:hypothetical protein